MAANWQNWQALHGVRSPPRSTPTLIPFIPPAPRMGLELTDTASRCTTGKAVGSHEFEIDGYSLKKGMGVGKFVRSATFTVGGYNWAIRFYPDGFTEDAKDHVAICLEFMSSNAKVRAFHDMGLVKHATGLMGAGFVRSETMVFTSTAAIDKTTIPRVKLEGSKYIQDDRLIIKCVLTVLKESQVFQTKGSSEIEVPPSNITEDLGKLLGAKEGADVFPCALVLVLQWLPCTVVYHHLQITTSLVVDI